MRLIISQTKVEYWNISGEVFQYPINSNTINGVFSLSTMFELKPQHYTDRVILTEV